MSRRGANIYKRKDGRWEARYLQVSGETGLKKYVSVYGKTYKEARSKQAAGMQQNVVFKSHELPLQNLAAEWLSGTRTRLKRSSYQKYESLLRNHIYTSPFAKLPAAKVTGKMITSFAAQKAAVLSAKTVNDILVILNLVFRYGQEEYGLPKPIFHHIKEPVKEIRVLSLEEQKRLEAHLWQDPDPWKLGVMLALYTGIRLGELCALQWEDIADSSIQINKTLHRIKHGSSTILEVTEPKTRRSNRKIPLPSFLLPVLEKFRDTGPVLKSPKGTAAEPRLVQIRFAAMVRSCGIAHTNFHALRHTFATRCVEAGFDVKSLSEILGHTDVKTTLNRYVHSSFEQKQRNMELLQPALSISPSANWSVLPKVR